MKRIERYKALDGRNPYREWVEELDEDVQGRVFAYVDRVAVGGAKRNVKPVGEGVFEVKIDIGPGFRVYFGEIGDKLILLLIGGDKSTQTKDIRKAKEFWREYASR